MAGFPSLVGQTVSHYRIIVKLGEGGMGVVYRAVDERLKRDVALKFLPETLAKDEHALSRLQREAEAASRLNHPNICTIYEIAEHSGRVFIVMELIFGRTLKNHISGALLSITETLDIAIQIADALDTAHESGVIHRDVKPENVIITTRGLAKVLDFGLARIQSQNNRTILTSREGLTASDSERLTRLGDLIGTVAYMSPEQARGEDLDNRTDLFSFGTLLYEISAGSLPFCGNGSVAMLHAILENVPIPPTRLNPDIPRELERIITKALEKDRTFRYQRASEIRIDLEKLKADLESKRTETNSEDEEPVAQSRVLEAAAPKQSLVGRATEILAVIMLPDSDGLRKYINEEQLKSVTVDDVRRKLFFLSFPDLNGKPQPAEVVLKLDSPNFEPRSQNKKLKVPPKHDSEICTFLLTPLLVGELVVNLELLVGDQIVVSRSIRTRAVPEGAPISSEKVRVVVCLPLVLLVGGESLSNPVLDEMSIPPSSTKPRSLSGRVGAALGVLVFIAIAAFLYAHRQYGPKVVVKPPDKTQQDVKEYGPVPPPPADRTQQDAKDHGQISAADRTEQEKLEDAKRLREEYEQMLKAGRSPDGTIEADIDMDSYYIDVLINKLSTAFSNKSISELQEIWPQMGGEKELIEREFDSAQTIRRTFHVKPWRFSSDRMTAEVSGSYEGKIITIDGKEVPSSGKFTLKLSKRDGNWYIDKAKF
jgi:serine/threonine protein kinase